MPAVLVKTVVFDRDLYKPGHLVHRWTTLVTTHFTEHARVAAPKRTGEMAAGINGDTHQVGDRQVEGTIESPAPYTMYVIRGTGFPTKGREGRIYTTLGFGRRDGHGVVYLWGYKDPATGKFSRSGGARSERRRYAVRLKGHWMVLPPGGGFSKGWAFQVSGQEPNNFLAVAWRRTARNHRAIRGRMPSWISSP